MASSIQAWLAIALVAMVILPAGGVRPRTSLLRGEVAALQVAASGVIRTENAVALPEQAGAADPAAGDDPDPPAAAAGDAAANPAADAKAAADKPAADAKADGAAAKDGAADGKVGDGKAGADDAAEKAAEAGKNSGNNIGVNVDAVAKAVQDELKTRQGDMTPESADDDDAAPANPQEEAVKEAQATQAEKVKAAQEKAAEDADADLPLSEQKVKPKSIEDAREMCKEECKKKAKEDDAAAAPEDKAAPANGTVSQACIEQCVNEKKSLIDPADGYKNLEKLGSKVDPNDVDSPDDDSLDDDAGNSTAPVNGTFGTNVTTTADPLIAGMLLDGDKFNVTDPVGRARAALARQEDFVQDLTDEMEKLKALKKTMPEEQYKLMMLRMALMNALRSKDMSKRQDAEKRIENMRNQIKQLEQNMIQSDLEAQKAKRAQMEMKMKMSMDEKEFAKMQAQNALDGSKSDWVSKQEQQDQENSEMQAEDHVKWASGLENPPGKDERRAQNEPQEISAMADAARQEMLDVRDRLAEAKKRVEELEQLQQGMPDLQTLMHSKAAAFHVKMKEAHEQSKAEHEQRQAEIREEIAKEQEIIESYQQKAEDEKQQAEWELRAAGDGANSTLWTDAMGDLRPGLNDSSLSNPQLSGATNGTNEWDKLDVVDTSNDTVPINGTTLHPTPIDVGGMSVENSTLADRLLANSTAGPQLGVDNKVAEEMTKQMSAEQAAKTNADLAKMKAGSHDAGAEAVDAMEHPSSPPLATPSPLAIPAVGRGSVVGGGAEVGINTPPMETFESGQSGVVSSVAVSPGE